jgi:hypothetical protein
MNNYYHRTDINGAVLCSRNRCPKTPTHLIGYPSLEPGDACCAEHAEWRRRALPGVHVRRIPGEG